MGIILLSFIISIYFYPQIPEKIASHWNAQGSEIVWEKTHKIGGKLFKIVGVITFLGVFFQSYALFFLLVPVISDAAYTIYLFLLGISKGDKMIRLIYK